MLVVVDSCWQDGVDVILIYVAIVSNNCILRTKRDRFMWDIHLMSLANLDLKDLDFKVEVLVGLSLRCDHKCVDSLGRSVGLEVISLVCSCKLLKILLFTTLARSERMSYDIQEVEGEVI